VKPVFDDDALLEAREAAAWYEGVQPGLGRAFLDALEEATDDILRHPLRWRRIRGRFRRRLLRRFPFGLIYAIEGDVIYIPAVAHLHRKPGYWLSRIR
jgi:hypothetical protein